MTRVTVSDILDVLIEFSLKVTNKKQATEFIKKDQKKHMKINLFLISKFKITKSDVVVECRKVIGSAKVEMKNDLETMKQEISKYTSIQSELQRQITELNDVTKPLFEERKEKMKQGAIFILT